MGLQASWQCTQYNSVIREESNCSNFTCSYIFVQASFISFISPVFLKYLPVWEGRKHAFWKRCFQDVALFLSMVEAHCRQFPSLILNSFQLLWGPLISSLPWCLVPRWWETAINVHINQVGGSEDEGRWFLHFGYHPIRWLKQGRWKWLPHTSKKKFRRMLILSFPQNVPLV